MLVGAGTGGKPCGAWFVSVLAVCPALGTDSVDDFAPGRDGPPSRPFVFGAHGDRALPIHCLLTCGDTCRACIRYLDFVVAMRF